MHFWIDKRSQTCGFGRARVAASLSGSTGVGLGFGHPPRRMVGKSLVTPSIHRMQAASASSGNSSSAPGTAAIEYNNRSHNNNVNNSNNNNNATHNNNSNLNRNNRNRNGNGNNNSNNNSTSTAQIHHHENNVSQCHLPSNNNNSNNNSNNGTGLNTRQHYQHSITGNIHNQNDIQHSPLPSVNNNQECSIPVTLPHTIYGGPSHAQDLEQGSLGLDPITARPNLSGVIGGTMSTNVAIVDTSDSQLLPSHLKCGMWASLVLASVFVAGAKFYFDHQGTGLEVLIFCAFSATFFLAACTVSLCRLPRDLTATPSQSVDGHNHTLDDNHHIISSNNNSHLHYHHNQQQQQQLYSQNPEQILEIPITTNAHYQNHHHHQHQQYYQSSHPNTISAPPPPYHIAILLPENSKDMQLDETPPPSYDKILI